MFKNRFLIWLFILSLALFAGGCATAPRGRVTDLKKRIYLKDFCDRYGVAWQWDHISQVVELKLEGTQARLLVGSNMMLLGKEQVKLGAPVALDQSSVMVPPDFQAKITGKLKKQPVARVSRALRKIREAVIDAGHGGKDPGAIGVTGVKEKTVVLDIARRLHKLLEKEGIRVVMTRADDTFISLEKRTEIASRAKADVFISIHANASPARSVHGMEAYSLRELGTLEKNEAQREINHRLMFKNLAMKRNSPSVEDIVSDMLYTYKQSVSSQLAADLVCRACQSAKTRDRGDKRARFFVLRNTLIPAVLVEVGFLTNPKEERLLKSGDYRQKIAEGLARSLLGYADGR